MADDLFNAPTDQGVDQNTDYLSELVGDGKKFKDTAALARGKLEADRHIANLTKTLDELRGELKTRTTEEELINRIAALQNRQTETPREPTPPENRDTATGLTREDVERLLSERDNQNRQSQNLATVQAKLAERYGDAAAIEIEKKSQELGISKDELRGMAATKPSVFLALFPAQNNTKPDIFGAPVQGRNTQLNTGAPSGVKKFSDFQKLRREKPTEYFGPAVQKEILAIGDRLGGPGNPAYEAWKNS